MAARRRAQRQGGSLGAAPPGIRGPGPSRRCTRGLVELLESLRPDEIADERYRTYVRDVVTEFDAHLLELDALLDSGPPTQSTRCS